MSEDKIDDQREQDRAEKTIKAMRESVSRIELGFAYGFVFALIAHCCRCRDELKL